MSFSTSSLRTVSGKSYPARIMTQTNAISRQVKRVDCPVIKSTGRNTEWLIGLLIGYMTAHNCTLSCLSNTLAENQARRILYFQNWGQDWRYMHALSSTIHIISHNHACASSMSSERLSFRDLHRERITGWSPRWRTTGNIDASLSSLDNEPIVGGFLLHPITSTWKWIEMLLWEACYTRWRLEPIN